MPTITCKKLIEVKLGEASLVTTCKLEENHLGDCLLSFEDDLDIDKILEEVEPCLS